MTTIILPPEIEQGLAKEAVLRGTTPELLALDILREQVAPTGASAARTSATSLAEWLSPFIGILSSTEHVAGGAAMSVDTGKKFAAGLALKHTMDRSP